MGKLLYLMQYCVYLMKKNKNTETNNGRRKFLADGVKFAGSAVLLASPLAGFGYRKTQKRITVGQIMDVFISQVKGAPFTGTVDTLKAGNRDMVVTGVVTAMFATIEVIKKAIALGANFIIAHEPTFYNHEDATQWIEDDEVYKYKASLLKQNNIAVWRNHDYIHSIHPDGVTKAVVDELGWNNYGDPDQHVFNFDKAISLRVLIKDIKLKMNVPTLRYAGDLDMPCKKIVLLPGAAGRIKHIGITTKNNADVLVCGEVSEWETAEYFRDANAAGKKMALIVLGHIASEEAGSLFMQNWMRQHFPSLKTTFIRSGSSLSFM